MHLSGFIRCENVVKAGKQYLFIALILIPKVIKKPKTSIGQLLIFFEHSFIGNCQRYTYFKLLAFLQGKLSKTQQWRECPFCRRACRALALEGSQSRRLPRQGPIRCGDARFLARAKRHEMLERQLGRRFVRLPADAGLLPAILESIKRSLHLPLALPGSGE